MLLPNKEMCQYIGPILSFDVFFDTAVTHEFPPDRSIKCYLNSPYKEIFPKTRDGHLNNFFRLNIQAIMN